MRRRPAIASCLVFSGLSALVYQIVWTRLLGFAFGTTTEAIGTVLGVFFGGLALGNGLAARWMDRLKRPLRAYAWLELGIGTFALASLPLLRHLDRLYLWVGVPHSPAALTAIRLVAVAAILLPPTAAMGATLPVVARGLIGEDASLGRWSALLYAANTVGAVLGAYLCGFWMIPELGLTRSVIAAGLLNLAVAAVVLAVSGPRRTPALAASASAPARRGPAIFLAFFAVSGFVAIGYEIIWSKVFGIVMEGTLYGFATVLSACLLGIGLGSLAIAPRVDRIRDLPRAFGLLHLAIAAAVALGMTAVPYLPYAYHRLAERVPGGDAVHLLFLLVLPIVLLPTALFGAAFPVLIRIYSPSARGVGRGMGVATAVNTAGSIAASAAVGFWWIPRLGMDASLYLLVLIDLGVALLVLMRSRGPSGAVRRGTLAGATGVLLWVSLAFDGVQVERAIAGRQIRASTLADYGRGLERAAASEALTIEGRSSIVTIHDLPELRVLRTNGLPEAGFRYAPPHYSLETVLLGLVPYLTTASPDRALVIGLGGGNTVNALLRSGVGAIEVVELEEGVVEAMEVLYQGRENPLDDPRVRLRLNDGRNELLIGSFDRRPRTPIIASQPSHPWRIGAANLFTEEFFRLARRNLSEGGRFALWVNGFRTDAESLLAVITSFERVFPGSVLWNAGSDGPNTAFLLLGGREPISLDLPTLAERVAEPGVAGLLEPFGIRSAEDLIARIEGPLAPFAAISPEAANTDDNAFVETRIPRRLAWPDLDFAGIEARLAPEAPVLPPLRGALDLVELGRAMLRSFEDEPHWPYAAKLERLLRRRGRDLDPIDRALLGAAARLRDPASEAGALTALRALADAHPAEAEPLRLLGRHLAVRRGRFAEAARAFAEAHARSGEARDAYDTGRALHHLDPERAWSWFERIPGPLRPRFPRLAFYAAERALREGLRGEELRPAYAALQRYRDTEEGRSFPGVDELLSQIAYSLGDRSAGRAHADASRLRRLQRGRRALARAESALAAGRPELAAASLERAQALLPAEGGVTALRARIALERGDPAALERALRDLRGWAPSLRIGIAAENRFRSRHDLPLLPEHPRR